VDLLDRVMRDTITKYIGFAEFCQDRAASTNDAKQRLLFEAMAIEWRRIATSYEGLMRRISPSGDGR
jgi:hypothetical protein